MQFSWSLVPVIQQMLSYAVTALLQTRDAPLYPAARAAKIRKVEKELRPGREER